MTSHNGPETSDSVNLGSNPSPPATTNTDISGVSGEIRPAEQSEPAEQNADTGRTKVGTAPNDVDAYGNPVSGDRLIYCCFPDCGCAGARLCNAETGANWASTQLNLERTARSPSPSGRAS